MATAPLSQAFTETNYAVTAVVMESGAPVSQTMDHQGVGTPSLGGYVCVCVCVCVHVCTTMGLRYVTRDTRGCTGVTGDTRGFPIHRVSP